MSTNFVVTLEATNPTRIPGFIQHILGTISIAGKEIGTINGLNRNLTIAPNSTTDISIPVSVSNIDTLFAGSTLAKGQKVTVDYKVISPVGNIEGTKTITLGA
jgi:LEA14-like dessication related protein